MKHGFRIYTEDTGGLLTDKNHMNYKWLNPDCNILFSVCRQGNAASIHFASDKSGLKKIRPAVNDFCEYIFNHFWWCEMIFGKIVKENITKIAQDCGFVFVSKVRDVWVYVRRR